MTTLIQDEPDEKSCPMYGAKENEKCHLAECRWRFKVCYRPWIHSTVVDNDSNSSV